MDNHINALWVFDWKVDEYGWPTKKTARLVARGDEQSVNLTLDNCLRPLCCVSSVRLITAMACELVLDLRHFDI